MRRGTTLASALPKPRLCSQGDPPRRPSLTPFPLSIWAFAPLPPKNAVRVSRKGTVHRITRPASPASPRSFQRPGLSSVSSLRLI